MATRFRRLPKPAVDAVQLDTLPYEVTEIADAFHVVCLPTRKVVTGPYTRRGMAQHEADRLNGEAWRHFLEETARKTT